jgi:hypothetical protein
VAQMNRSESKYPLLPASNWWKLRRQFKRSMPRQPLDAAFVSTLLDITPKSASDSIIPRLKGLGLLDSNGLPTDRANRWRDDSQYAQVCQEIRNEIYPTSLLDLFPDADADRSAVVNWFAHQARVGQSAANQMAAMYLLLLRADVAGDTESDKAQTKSTGSNQGQRVKPQKEAKVQRGEEGVRPLSSSEGEDRPSPPPPIYPPVHIDLQIHSSPDASPDQIDTIFASMARHLYGR